MFSKKEVVFDAFPDSPLRYRDHDAVVCIDVIGTTTTLVTALAGGRKAVPVSSTRPEAADILANASGCAAVYVACFRNLSATAAAVADGIGEQAGRIAILAAGARGQLRCEDQMASAWIVEKLLARGFHATDNRTEDLARRWSGASIALVRWGNSAEELRQAGRQDELDFLLAHHDDLDFACMLAGGEAHRVDGHAAALPPEAPSRGWRAAVTAEAPPFAIARDLALATAPGSRLER